MAVVARKRNKGFPENPLKIISVIVETKTITNTNNRIARWGVMDPSCFHCQLYIFYHKIHPYIILVEITILLIDIYGKRKCGKYS